MSAQMLSGVVSANTASDLPSSTADGMQQLEARAAAAASAAPAQQAAQGKGDIIDCSLSY